MTFKLSHSNLNVQDLEKSVKFYQDALRMKVVRHHKPDDESFELVFLSDESTSHQIELTWLRDKAGAYDLGENESHIAFFTDDFDKAYELHQKMGCICYENKAMGIYFIEDPDGYWIEIVPVKNN